MDVSISRAVGLSSKTLALVHFPSLYFMRQVLLFLPITWASSQVQNLVGTGQLEAILRQ